MNKFLITFAASCILLTTASFAQSTGLVPLGNCTQYNNNTTLLNACQNIQTNVQQLIQNIKNTYTTSVNTYQGGLTPTPLTQPATQKFSTPVLPQQTQPKTNNQPKGNPSSSGVYY